MRILETDFYQALRDWAMEVNLHDFESMNVARVGCEPYKKLLDMGEKALPLIKKVYSATRNDNGVGKEGSYAQFSSVVFHGLPVLVGEIVGSRFGIPKEIQGKMLAIRDYTMNWLEQNVK